MHCLSAAQYNVKFNILSYLLRSSKIPLQDFFFMDFSLFFTTNWHNSKTFSLQLFSFLFFMALYANNTPMVCGRSIQIGNSFLFFFSLHTHFPFPARDIRGSFGSFATKRVELRRRTERFPSNGMRVHRNSPHTICNVIKMLHVTSASLLRALKMFFNKYPHNVVIMRKLKVRE